MVETWIPEVSPDKTELASSWCSVLNLPNVAVLCNRHLFTRPPSPREDGDHRMGVTSFARLPSWDDAAAGTRTQQHSSQTGRSLWRKRRSSHTGSPRQSVRLCVAATGQKNRVPASCLCTRTKMSRHVLFLLMTFSVRAEKKDGLTGFWGRHALGEHAVRDDAEHAEWKHHGEDGEAQLEHSLHLSLRRWRNTLLKCCTSLTTLTRGMRGSRGFYRMTNPPLIQTNMRMLTGYLCIHKHAYYLCYSTLHQHWKTSTTIHPC